MTIENIEDKKNIINHISKLSWACRRGMYELDVLLGNFLKDAYMSLQFDDKLHFVSLLSCEDPKIYAWLMDYEVPEDPNLVRITNMIRDHARSRI